MDRDEQKAWDLRKDLESLQQAEVVPHEALNRLADVAEETRALAGAEIWTTRGWHLVEIDRLIRVLGASVQDFAKRAEIIGRTGLDREAAKKLLLALVELCREMVVNLRTLGWRTSNWVEIYKAIDDALEVFDLTLDLDEEAMQRACALLNSLEGAEKTALREFYERAFRNAGSFECHGTGDVA